MIWWRLLFACLLLSLLTVSGQVAEFRGLWVDAFQDGFKTHDQVTKLVTEVRKARLNTLLVEVRKRADAYYQSKLEPIAEDIAPDYDPLADLLIQARSQDPSLEVHAWFVTYPAWSRRDNPPLSKEHVLNRHPDWLCRDFDGQTWSDENYYLDPGHPQVQAHLFQVAIDLISRYKVDGLHFDYIRYPGLEWGYNPVAVRRFNVIHGRSGKPKPQDSLWMQFRRDQVTALLRRIYLSATTLQPSLKISAATITWTPSPSENVSWQETAAYSQVFQDWRGWMEEGILDLNIPMVYFRQQLNGTDWERWSAFIKDHGYQRHVALGIGSFLNDWPSNLQQVHSSRTPSPSGNRSHGVALFSYHSLRESNRSMLLPLSESLPPETSALFTELAEIPKMPWKTSLTAARLLGYISGLPKSNAVDSASLRLEGPTNVVRWSDATGFYGLSQIPPGTYSLTVSAKGHAPGSHTLTLSPGQTTVQSMLLELPDKKP